MRTQVEQAFSLVELLIAFAIVAVLIGLSTYGVGVATRNSRESQRLEVLTNVRLKLDEHYLKYGTYPANDRVSFTTNQIRVCKPDNSSCESIPLSQGFLAGSNSNTNNSRTRYCYRQITSDRLYALCYRTEKGDWKNIGISSTQCSDTLCSTGSVLPPCVTPPCMI
jgi:type II secretory pathway pseudopilin PulG